MSIESEYYAHVVSELARLTAIKSALDRAPVAQKEPAKGRTRPPRGQATESVLGVLSAQGLTNDEVQSKLRANGYKHALKTIPMGKLLNRLVAKKKVKKTKNGDRIEFSLP